jgi:hypothetical protein
MFVEVTLWRSSILIALHCSSSSVRFERLIILAAQLPVEGPFVETRVIKRGGS